MEITINVEEFGYVDEKTGIAYNIIGVYNTSDGKLLNTYKRDYATGTPAQHGNQIAKKYQEKGYKIYDIRIR